MADPPIPITIITGFLGSGKTTLILNLIPQLPPAYRLALIKNEFGDVAVDSKLAGAAAITGVQELLNGCICCNLVGSLQEALETLRKDYTPDRIIIETSGSAFPATLAMEVNRIARKTGHYLLDGVITVIDVENWKGYDDTSVTAKLQAQYTDLLVLNKWELVSERRYEECIDRVLDLELDLPTPHVKSDKGWVDRDLLLGLDTKLVKMTKHGDHMHYLHDHSHEHEGHDYHSHNADHSAEVEVLSITMHGSSKSNAIDLEKLEHLLNSAPKDEVYRIKGLLYAFDAPCSSTGDCAEPPPTKGVSRRYILNWAFGRWTYTADSANDDAEASELGDLLLMTIVTARYEADKWRSRTESGEFLAAVHDNEPTSLSVTRVL
jgi:G3E family GTPase